MTDDRAEHAARLLVEARRTGRKLAGLPESCRPADRAACYAIHDATMRALGAVGGWKVGAASPDAEPNAAPLPADLVFAGPATLEAAKFGLLGIESEIAFRFARALPPRDAPYGRDEVLGAVASVHPAIEIVDTRYADLRAQDPLSLLADLQSNGGFVYGPARTTGFDIDQTKQAVVQSFDGVPVAQRVGANSGGDVIRMLVWLANHARAHGGVAAGQFVTTGSCTGMMPAKPGTHVTAEFPGLGRVEVTLA